MDAATDARSSDGAFWSSRGRSRARAAIALAVATGLGFSHEAARASSAGGNLGTVDGDGRGLAAGRGLQLLGAREAILLDQCERARKSARARGLELYRLLRSAALERRREATFSWYATPPSVGGRSPPKAAAPSEGERVGGRGVALATMVLRRDIEEEALLRAELERVRAERASLALAVTGAAATATAEAEPEPPSPSSLVFSRPVSGPPLVGFGVDKDAATGVWMFRAAATFSARAGESVRSPCDCRVVRVASSVAGGAAVVLAHERGRWTVVLSGLESVAVAAGEVVKSGDVLGSMPRARPSQLRVETWRGRTPVDPAVVLRPR